ncbi:hypothetical protein OSB04_006904 [Centaurea solstitialis]|uniref:Uncharacterized protein n=1 Tax=Centaurea solstitialis TaxID=347529 RepID=A0AA38TKL6_9ASTR|nr:hypothetical protein OSB04_006904 [Centaurea solstitialis]
MTQPDYWNDSSSTDTDEDWEQDAQMFAHLVQQANASSSIPRSKAPNIDRGRVEGNARLIADYFSDNPTYPEEMFKRRFRMSRNLFIRIVYDLYTRYPYFQQHYDVLGIVAYICAAENNRKQSLNTDPILKLCRYNQVGFRVYTFAKNTGTRLGNTPLLTRLENRLLDHPGLPPQTKNSGWLGA